MALDKVKTEHTGAKNGGGSWGHRVDVKRASRKRRRRAAREECWPASLPKDRRPW